MSEIFKSIAGVGDFVELPESAGLTPSEDVLKRIAHVTTQWENQADDMYYKDRRRRYIDSALVRFIDSEYMQIATHALEGTPEQGLVRHLERILRDLEYWVTTLGTLQRKGETVLDEWTERLIEANEEMDTSIRENRTPPARSRIQINVTMGQGVSGDLRRFIFYSEKYSSCSAVAMYNDKTYVGGLFHFGAGDVKQEQKLKELHNKVDPTHVWMAGSFAEGCIHKDCETLQGWFPRNEIEKIDGAKMYLYLKDEAPNFTNDCPESPKATLVLTRTTEIPERLKTLPARMYHEPETYSEQFA